MTPMESILAYQAWCIANTAFQLQWRESGLVKNLKFGFLETALAKATELIPVVDKTVSPVFSIVTVPNQPTIEGYIEWLNQ